MGSISLHRFVVVFLGSTARLDDVTMLDSFTVWIVLVIDMVWWSNKKVKHAEIFRVGIKHNRSHVCRARCCDHHQQHFRVYSGWEHRPLGGSNTHSVRGQSKISFTFPKYKSLIKDLSTILSVVDVSAAAKTACLFLTVTVKGQEKKRLYQGLFIWVY